MRDKISLQVDNQRIEHFISYSIESDLYQAADAFSLELANPEIEVKAGARCELYVNDQREMTGIIERVIPSYSKDGVKLKLEGRDLMGLLVDAHCMEFITIKGTTVKGLAERLIFGTKTVPGIPFLDRKQIDYQENEKVAGKTRKHGKKKRPVGGFDAALSFAQIEPGQTVFEVLREYAMSRGLMFFNLDDGTFIFGKPTEKGEPAYRLITRKDGAGNMVKEGTFYQDISRGYSKITVLGESQGTNATATGQHSTIAVVEDKTYPFYKPFVAKNNNDSQSPKLHARMLLEKQRSDAFQLHYKVGGHSQNGRNWRINELCHVQDEAFKLDGTYLIYSRVLELSKDNGPITWLKLGLPGVIA